jgi:hypothetical protein
MIMFGSQPHRPIRCRGCTVERTISVDALLRRVDREATVREVVARLHCGRCRGAPDVVEIRRGRWITRLVGPGAY